MRVIVKEKQFDIIKKFILEAGPNIDNTAKANLGRSLLNFYKQLSINKFIEFGLRSGTKIVLKCVKASNNVFEFEIAKDDNGAIKNWDKLTLKINIGKQGQTNTDLYNNNQNIIKPSKGKNGFTIVFTGSNKEGKSNNVNFNDITKVSQTTEPKQEPKQEEPKISGDTEQSETSDNKITKADAKAAYEKILSNPELKNAFYKQPSFWEMFKAELKGEKPTGTGIITALDILDKYNLRRFNEKISNMLTPNEKVTIKFLENYTIKFDENKTLDFNSFEKYVLKIVKKNSNETQVLYGKKDNIDYYLPLTNPEPEKNNDIGDVFTSIIGKEKYMFRILTDEKESPGYNNESED